MRPRELEPSPLGEELKRLATNELRDHLYGTDQLAKDIIGYIAAADSGLTSGELGELAGASYVDLQARVGSNAFGRSLRPQLQTDMPAERAEPVYSFAHETLRAMADEELGYDLQHYRERIHQWADSYRQEGWPDHTPRYLGRPYSRLLTRTRDLPRLVGFVTDSRRHEWMLATTLTDSAALAELLDAQKLFLDTSEPDHDALELIDDEQDRLSLRNAAVQPQLPALWVRLGQPDRAESLACTITDPVKRASALAGVVAALAAAGQGERAEHLVRTITDPEWQTPEWQASALAGIAAALAAAGQEERAVRLAGEAEQLARTITNRDFRAATVAKTAAALAIAGQRERAEQLARTIHDSSKQASALAEIVRALAGVVAELAVAGQEERAVRLAGEAETVARDITDPDEQASALAHAAAALAAAGQEERAEQLARTITDSYWQASALAGIAAALAAGGPRERTVRLAVEAEQLARTITDPYWQVSALATVAVRLAAAGQGERAERLARTITDSDSQAWALAGIAAALAAAGQEEQAVRLAVEAETVARDIDHLRMVAQYQGRQTGGEDGVQEAG